MATKKVGNWFRNWTEAHEKMFMDNKKLAYFFARNWSRKIHNKIPTDELIALCMFGLAKSVAVFDPRRNVTFATFASRVIQNEVFVELRKIKKWENDLVLSYFNATDKFGEEKDIMESLEFLATEDKLEFMDAEETYELIQALSDQERMIIEMFYFEEMKQKEIGEALGLSQSYISRICHRAIRKMRRRAEKLYA